MVIGLSAALVGVAEILVGLFVFDELDEFYTPTAFLGGGISFYGYSRAMGWATARLLR